MLGKNPYQALLDISEELNTLQDSAALLDRIMDIAMDTLKAERGFILLKSGKKSGDFESVAARNISQEKIEGITGLSSSVVNEVMKSGAPVLTFDATSDERFSEARSVVLQQIRSIACTPMLRGERIVGAIYMDSRTDADRFNEESMDFLQAFARQAALALENMQQIEKLAKENRHLKRQISLSGIFPEIIGESREIQEILQTITQVADSTASVLIEGESGTGKELVARALHHHSSRNEKLFVPVFCGGLTESLLESELFGHKKGAFTGAIEDKPGLFEEANGGTIFLDEIGDINMNIQTKLLRVIQEGEIKRVGEAKIRKVNVRIVSATNKDLWKEVRNKNFREDLYYRLNVISINMPPLRNRGEDIVILAKHFLKKFARVNNKTIEGFTAASLKLLREYQWPGNIRELINAVERAVILSQDKLIPPGLFNLSRTRVTDLGGRTLQDIEKAAILETLEMTGNHRTRAAEILGVSRRWLQYRIKEWDLEV